jgi:inner membrane transporter RhtA
LGGLCHFRLDSTFPLQQAQQGLDLVGVFFAVSAGACWALYIIAGQKPSGISGNHTVCLGMSIGMLCLLPFAIFSGALDRVIELPNIYYFIGLAILASALPFTLEMIALRSLTPLSFGTLMSLEPAVAALSGFIFWVKLYCGINGLRLARLSSHRSVVHLPLNMLDSKSE